MKIIMFLRTARENRKNAERIFMRCISAYSWVSIRVYALRRRKIRSKVFTSCDGAATVISICDASVLHTHTLARSQIYIFMFIYIYTQVIYTYNTNCFFVIFFFLLLSPKQTQTPLYTCIIHIFYCCIRLYNTIRPASCTCV